MDRPGSEENPQPPCVMKTGSRLTGLLSETLTQNGVIVYGVVIHRENPWGNFTLAIRVSLTSIMQRLHYEH
jgi:hypothetical protein